MTPPMRRLLLNLFIAATGIVALSLAIHVGTGVLIHRSLLSGIEQMNADPRIKVSLERYQRGLFSAKGRLRIQSPWFSGPVQLSVKHGPIISRAQAPAWGVIHGQVASRHWLAALDLHLRDSHLGAFLPSVQLPKRVALPDLEIALRPLVSGGFDSHVRMDDFSYEGRLGYPSLNLLGVSGYFADRENAGSLSIDLQVQQLVIVDQATRRLAVTGLDLHNHYERLGDIETPFVTDLDMDRLEWSQAETALDLGNVNFEEGLFEEDWSRRIQLTVSEGRFIPPDDRNASASVQLAVEMRLRGIEPKLWDQVLHNALRDRLSDTSWPHATGPEIGIEFTRFDLKLDNNQGGLSGQLVLAASEDDAATWMQNLSGDLAVSFDRNLLATLVPWGIAPYFSQVMAEAETRTIDAERGALLDRHLEELVTVGRIQRSGKNRYRVQLQLADGELRINDQPVTMDIQ